MNPIKQIDPEDLTLYAMNLLGPAEAATVEAQLEQTATSRRELAEIRGDLATFALTAEAVSPAAHVRTSFLRRIAEEPRTAYLRTARPAQEASSDVEGGTIPIDTYRSTRPAAVPAPARKGVAARALPWAGWAVAAGLALAAGNLYRERQTLRETVAGNQAQLTRTAAEANSARDVLSALNDQTAMRVTLTRAGIPPSPTGRTVYSAEKGVLIFTATDLPAVDTFKVYELWLIPTTGGAPIPAGTFHPDAKGYANLVATDMPKGVEAKAFAMTVEDDGGSKVPTPPLVMTGA